MLLEKQMLLIMMQSGSDTSCTAILCAANEYVSSNTCIACAAGKTNAADNDASGSDTSCTAILCAANEYVSSNTCIACAAGKTNAADNDASGSDTSCTAILCVLMNMFQVIHV